MRNCDFEQVKRFRHLLTSRGRQQLRELNKRWVDQQYKERNGSKSKPKLLEELLVSKAGEYQRLFE